MAFHFTSNYLQTLLVIILITNLGHSVTIYSSSDASGFGGSSTTLCGNTFRWMNSGSTASLTFSFTPAGNYTDFYYTTFIWIYQNSGGEVVNINFNPSVSAQITTVTTAGSTFCGSGWYYQAITSATYRELCNQDSMTITITSNTFWGIQYFYLDGVNRCTDVAGCKCCLVANGTHCTQCYDTRVYLDTIINGCYPCDKTCRSCTQSFSERCSSCHSPLTLWYMGGSRVSCASSCWTNTYYYGGIAPSCVNCTDVNCATCAPESICTRCNSGYYLTGSTCTICNSNCLTCSGSATTCTGCPSGQFLKSGVCVSSCGTNYRNQSDVCQACLQPICISCPAAAGTCTSCPTSYFVDNSGVCQPCSWANCLSCSASTCFKCDSANGYYWDPVNLVCTLSCPNYYNYPNLVNGTCDRCSDTNCKLCPAAVGTCTSCDTTFFVSGSNACASCLANCDVCPDAVTCTTCTSGYSLVTGTPDQCIGSCPSAQMSLAGVCVGCTDANCLSCPSSQSTCIGCVSDYYWVNGGSCSPCIANCLYCTTGTTCAYCDVGYYYDSVGLSCGLTCPTYYRNNSATRNCDRCTDTNCMNCNNGLNNCSQCSVTFYVDPSTRTCFNCPANCDYCNSTGCLACSSSYYLMPDGTCISSCPTSYLTNSTSCLRCDDLNCLTCTPNTSVCTSCPINYFFINSTSQCGSCIDNCLNCADDVSCTLCDIGYYYLSPPDECVASCPIGYYTNTGTRTCDPCNAGNCTSCPLSPTICTECEQWTHYLSGSLTCPTCEPNCLNCTQTGYCLQCEERYYIKPSNGLCMSCPADCLECDTTGTRCTKCIPDYYLYLGNDSCVSSCDAPLWKNDIDRTCTICADSHCAFCPQNPSTCLQCDTLTFLNGTYCQSCPTECMSCTSSTQCTECNLDHYLYGTSCVLECPDGTSADEYRHCITEIIDSYVSGNASYRAVVAADICTGIMMGTGLPSAALGLGGPTMWSAFGSLQVVGMFNALQIKVPSNVRVFLGGLTTAHFSFLPSTITAKNESLTSTRTLTESSTKSADLGISSPAVYSDGSVFSSKGFPLLVVLITIYCLLIALVFLTWCNAFWKARKMMQWNGIIRISILLYLPLVSYSFMQISNGATNSEESTSLGLAFLGLIYCIAFFVCCAKILKRPIKELYQKDVEDKYGTLYSNHEVHNSKFAKYYSLIILIRSSCQGIFVAFMKSAPSVQLVFLLIIDFVLIYKMVAERVFAKKADRRLLILQQGCVIFSEICMLVFSTVDLSYSAGNVIGWALIVVVLGSLILNMLRVLYLLFICIFKTQSPKKLDKRADRIRIVPFNLDESKQRIKVISKTPSWTSEINA